MYWKEREGSGRELGFGEGGKRGRVWEEVRGANEGRSCFWLLKSGWVCELGIEEGPVIAEEEVFTAVEENFEDAEADVGEAGGIEVMLNAIDSKLE